MLKQVWPGMIFMSITCLRFFANITKERGIYSEDMLATTVNEEALVLYLT